MCKDCKLRILKSKDWLYLIDIFWTGEEISPYVFFILLGEYEEALKVIVIPSYFQIICKCLLIKLEPEFCWPWGETIEYK